MDNDTKPTAGALRAARAILSEVDPTACTQFDYENDVQGMARLIDRETSAPDLVAALERLTRAAEYRDNHAGDPIRLIETREELRAAAKIARAALRKAGIEC